jgi:hypothetical protein
MTEQSNQFGPDVCCTDWDHAQEDETDSEMCGPLIDYDPCQNGWRMGQDLPVVAFCPWCGARKTRTNEEGE